MLEKELNIDNLNINYGRVLELNPEFLESDEMYLNDEYFYRHPEMYRTIIDDSYEIE